MAPDEPPPTGELTENPLLLHGDNATNITQLWQCLEVPLSSLPVYQFKVDPTYAMVELYCAATLIMVCAVSVLNNACVLLSTCWIKRRPLSTTMRISLSLTGADTIASFFLGVSWFINNILNSLVPQDPDTFEPVVVNNECMRVAPERLACIKLALEALRLGAVLVTMLHLLALASNHYLGALRPLQSHVRHAYLCVGLAAIWIVPEAALFAYFASFDDDGFRRPEGCGYKFLLRYEFHITFSLIFFFVLILMICIYVHIYIIVQRHERTRHRFRRTGSSHQRAELKQLNGAAGGAGGAGGAGAAQKQAVQRSEPSAWSAPEAAAAAAAAAAAKPSGLLRSTRSRRGGSPQFRRNKKAIVTTLFILGSYLIGWMPAVVSFMLVCDDHCLIPRSSLNFNSLYTIFIFWSFNMLIVIKTLANSFIYTSRMKEIKDARRSMCNALARRCCRFLPQSADPVRGALFGGPPSESTQLQQLQQQQGGRSLPQSADPVRGALFGGPPSESTQLQQLQQQQGGRSLSLYSRSSTRRLQLNGIGQHGRRREQQSDV